MTEKPSSSSESSIRERTTGSSSTIRIVGAAAVGGAGATASCAKFVSSALRSMQLSDQRVQAADCGREVIVQGNVMRPALKYYLSTANRTPILSASRPLSWQRRRTLPSRDNDRRNSGGRSSVKGSMISAPLSEISSVLHSPIGQP